MSKGRAEDSVLTASSARTSGGDEVAVMGARKTTTDGTRRAATPAKRESGDIYSLPRERRKRRFDDSMK